MSAGGVQLPQQPVQVAEPLRPRRVLERLVLGKDVDEALAEVVTVLPQGFPAPLAQPVDHLADLVLGAEKIRHWAAVRSS